MRVLDEQDGIDSELLVFAMTLINKTLYGVPDQDTFYDVTDAIEMQNMEAIQNRYRTKKGADKKDTGVKITIFHQKNHEKSPHFDNLKKCKNLYDKNIDGLKF